MDTPFFSIITATRNVASTLPCLLDSLVAQTCHDFELVAQDGGSQDNTAAVLESYRGRLPALSLISEQDTGIYDAWNKALDRVRGQWILFLGADDSLADVEVLARARDFLVHAEPDIFYAAGDVFLFHALGKPFGLFPTPASDVLKQLRMKMPYCHTGLFHKTTLFSTNRFDHTFSVLGDYEFLCRTLKCDTQVVTLGFTVTHMALGGISSKLCWQPRIFMESLRVAWRHFGRVTAHHARVGIKVALVAIFCRALGTQRASKFLDITRSWRGKPPLWVLSELPPQGLCVISMSALKSDSCAVVILNHNGWQDTVDCLRSVCTLLPKPRCVIVVDNNSHDDSVERILREWKTFAEPVVYESSNLFEPPPAAAMVLLSENGGYAAGNNEGIRVALRDLNCRSVWILNNDTKPDVNSLQRLCDRLNACPKAGMVGSTLVYAHDRETVQCAGGFSLSKYTGATVALHGSERLSAMPGLDPTSVEGRLSYLCGASKLIRREVLERIGLFAEEYFLYYEDAEFGLRAKKAGYTLAWAPGSVVFHKEGSSTGAKSSGAGRIVVRSEFVDYIALRNRIYLIRQHYPAYLPVTVLSYVGVILNRLRRGQGHRVPLVLQALWDGLRGRMGIALPFRIKG